MARLRHTRFTPFARFGFWLALVFASYMAINPRPPRLPIDTFGDRFEHMLAFLVLTILAQSGFDGTPRRLIAERLSFFGAMIELVQSIPALHRDCDIRDWIADTAVAFAVTAIFALLDRRQPPPIPPPGA